MPIAELYGSSAGTLATATATFSEIVAPPNAPARMPTSVMPIWTVDRKRLGSCANASAFAAAREPSSDNFCRRALREETTEISAIAKTPFASSRQNTMTIFQQDIVHEWEKVRFRETQTPRRQPGRIGFSAPQVNGGTPGRGG